MIQNQHKSQHTPIRTCIACHNKSPKRELDRIVCDSKGNLQLDKEQLLPGRGAYICRNIDCISKAVKTSAFDRSLRRQINPDSGKQLIARMYNE